MAQRVSAHSMPSTHSRKHFVNNPSRKSIGVRQDNNFRLTKGDKEALDEIMTGKAEVTSYSAEEYLAKIKAELNESA